MLAEHVPGHDDVDVGQGEEGQQGLGAVERLADERPRRGDHCRDVGRCPGVGCCRARAPEHPPAEHDGGDVAQAAAEQRDALGGPPPEQGEAREAGDAGQHVDPRQGGPPLLALEDPDLGAHDRGRHGQRREHERGHHASPAAAARSRRGRGRAAPADGQGGGGSRRAGSRARSGRPTPGSATIRRAAVAWRPMLTTAMTISRLSRAKKAPYDAVSRMPAATMVKPKVQTFITAVPTMMPPLPLRNRRSDAPSRSCDGGDRREAAAARRGAGWPRSARTSRTESTPRPRRRPARPSESAR